MKYNTNVNILLEYELLISFFLPTVCLNYLQSKNLLHNTYLISLNLLCRLFKFMMCLVTDLSIILFGTADAMK